MVAFFYINNFWAFPVGLEELFKKVGVPEKYAAGKTLCVAGLDLIEMARVHPVCVATARRAVSYVLLLMASSLVSPVYLLL